MRAVEMLQYLMFCRAKIAHAFEGETLVNLVSAS